MHRPRLQFRAAQNRPVLRRCVNRSGDAPRNCQATRPVSAWVLGVLAVLLGNVWTIALLADDEVLTGTSEPPTLTATIEKPSDARPSGAVIVSGWRADDLKQLRGWPGRDPRWGDVIDIRVVPESVGGGNEYGAAVNAIPRVSGTFLAGADSVQFQPRYPLSPGVRYRVIARGVAGRPGLGEKSDPKSAIEKPALKTVLSLPKRSPLVATAISGLYPTLDVVPENLLRIYIHFSAPMSRGSAYEYISLLDDDGNAVPHPFLELGEELWDPEQRRFTLYFDPGRIKRGLQPNELFGTPLRAGRRYTLVIDRAWPDATGHPLSQEVRRTFRVTGPDRTQPDFSAWELTVPAANSRTPLAVAFTEPLDQALLQRMITVQCGDERVAGEVAVSKRQTVWSFTPEEPWEPGTYTLVADGLLEDRSGNSLARPFEVPEDATSQDGPSVFTRQFVITARSASQ